MEGIGLGGAGGEGIPGQPRAGRIQFAPAHCPQVERARRALRRRLDRKVRFISLGNGLWAQRAAEVRRAAEHPGSRTALNRLLLRGVVGERSITMTNPGAARGGASQAQASMDASDGAPRPPNRDPGHVLDDLDDPTDATVLDLDVPTTLGGRRPS